MNNVVDGLRQTLLTKLSDQWSKVVFEVSVVEVHSRRWLAVYVFVLRESLRSILPGNDIQFGSIVMSVDSIISSAGFGSRICRFDGSIRTTRLLGGEKDVYHFRLPVQIGGNSPDFKDFFPGIR